MVGSVQVHNQRESVALDMKAYSHLSAEERIRIDELRNREGLGVRQIALRISHGKPTVSREPRRGPETPNEAWYRELGKVMSKTSHPQTNVALTNR